MPLQQHNNTTNPLFGNQHQIQPQYVLEDTRQVLSQPGSMRKHASQLHLALQEFENKTQPPIQRQPRRSSQPLPQAQRPPQTTFRHSFSQNFQHPRESVSFNQQANNQAFAPYPNPPLSTNRHSFSDTAQPSKPIVLSQQITLNQQKYEGTERVQEFERQIKENSIRIAELKEEIAEDETELKEAHKKKAKNEKWRENIVYERIQFEKELRALDSGEMV